MRTLQGSFVLVVLAWIVSGCDLGGPGPHPRRGEIGVVFSAGGETITSREAVYDVGTLVAGQPATTTIVIRNVGAGPLELVSLEKVEGNADVRIGESASGEAPVFAVEAFPQGHSLSVNEVLELDVTYAPHVVGRVGQHEVKLLLRAANTARGEETAVITLRGRAVSEACAVAERIEFGNVTKGDVQALSFALHNPSASTVTAFIDEVRSGSGDHAAFEFGASSARGDVEIAPGGSADVTLAFRPTEVKSYLAFMKVQAAEGCPEVNVKLEGQGVVNVLSWTGPLFGLVPPGLEGRAEVTFSNEGATDVKLGALQLSDDEQFAVVGPGGAGETGITVPGATRDAAGLWQPGTAALTVACRPRTVGQHVSRLSFDTSIAAAPNGELTLRCTGGGPDIDVSSALEFGDVAYFANASPPTSQHRTLTVRNLGSTPTGPEGNLRLTEVTIVPMNDATSPQEFEVSLPPAYDPDAGIGAAAGANRLDLRVTFTPASVGAKQAKITLASNDLDEPVVTVIVSAEAKDMPPCDYRVSASVLPFGQALPGDDVILGFTIRNNGTHPGDVCLLSNLELDPGSHPAFSLREGPIPGTVALDPGEVRQFGVRLRPEGTMPVGVTNLAGKVSFYVSSPLKPLGEVNLTAQLAPSCLMIAPRTFDFGTVQTGRKSLTRTFRVYNACGTPLALQGFRLQDASGLPAGSPLCLGAAACPEFIPVSTPAIPSGGLVLNPDDPPLTFQMIYRPLDVGSDQGSVAVDVTQLGFPVSYVVPVEGRSDPLGVHTDTFEQPSAPQADVLLTIDDSSCSSVEQDMIAINFSAFTSYANQRNVDFRIAVTTTDDDAVGGRFLFGTGHPEKVLTPATSNLNSKFELKVRPGVNGSATEMCFEPALRALTPPLSLTDNAGFLRPGASLAVVCLNEEPDQSPRPVSWYLDAFRNLKGFDRPGDFTFSAIGGLASGCPNDDGRLTQMIEATHGAALEICTPDWAGGMKAIGDVAFGYRTRFHLSMAPDTAVGPLEVKVDGVPVSSTGTGGATVWSYDPVANMVKFDPAYLPAVGSTLTISYPSLSVP